MTELILPPKPLDEDEPPANQLPGHCPGCIYAKQISHNAAKMYEGVCLRYPPVPIMLGMQANKIVGKPPMPVVQEFWPNVYAEWTCGEFKPVESRKLDS